MPSAIDIPPVGSPYYLYYKINGKAEQQSDWMTKAESYKTFRLMVRRHLKNDPEDDEIIEIGVYDDSLGATVMLFRHDRNGCV